MMTQLLRRRTVLQGLGGAALFAGMDVRSANAQQVLWSSGTEPAKIKMPADACDCHHHVYDGKFPIAPTATLKPGDAKAADYKLLQKRIGTTRSVVVQPSTYARTIPARSTAWHNSGPRRAASRRSTPA